MWHTNALLLRIGYPWEIIKDLSEEQVILLLSIEEVIDEMEAERIRRQHGG